MKYCPKCQIDKDLSEFRPNKTRKDGYQSYCIICDKEYQNEWYIKNSSVVKNRSKITRDIIRKRNREYIINYLKNHPCVKCNETDIIVLEFDHLRDKEFNISKGLDKYSIKKMQKEINKCQILCSNCHRRKTSKDFNWYKSLDHLPNIGLGISLQN